MCGLNLLFFENSSFFLLTKKQLLILFDVIRLDLSVSSITRAFMHFCLVSSAWVAAGLSASHDATLLLAGPIQVTF